jgi:hypothetical protein
MIGRVLVSDASKLSIPRPQQLGPLQVLLFISNRYFLAQFIPAFRKVLEIVYALFLRLLTHVRKLPMTKEKQHLLRL